ncbi:hypothetical protein Val02_39410 [Virgisporangium aliadipatigenens]|uniref:Carbohydrate kinase PfkB domain-containing protein n=1 Tax=Virgisporangium aliadipatigenens TaxID=741659 RepID=A0A8J3YND7_9ACTN|nr:PfkB family carbohydrate kinase [Virgisporangium aliadipatigenens]GIJ47055.1 hypothetical protein Val02_39410 [Virgisporangium aliadipatigenens]
MRTLVVVGDLLLDREIVGTADRLCPEAPVPVLVERGTHDRPGGAGLAALFAVGTGRFDEVVLVCGLAPDAGGRTLRALLTDAGVRVAPIPYDGSTVEKVRLRAGEQLLLRLDRGESGGRLGNVPGAARAALESAAAILVSDYGRGVAAHPALRPLLAGCAGRVPLVWDPHPKGPAPVPGAALVTPNRAEAAHFLPAASTDDGDGSRNGGHTAERLRLAWDAQAVAVTLGAEGAVLAGSDLDSAETIPAPYAATGDPCGAGDRFAAEAVSALALGKSTVDAVRAAVDAATDYVAEGSFLKEDLNA